MSFAASPGRADAAEARLDGGRQLGHVVDAGEPLDLVWFTPMSPSLSHVMRSSCRENAPRLVVDEQDGERPSG